MLCRTKINDRTHNGYGHFFIPAKNVGQNKVTQAQIMLLG